ncbi:MAG: type III-A CRISPR-associated RAMP protein Csm3 [Thalassobius sp.]|nr:type III-A CRISPR-associated RAMP protein Csm3 [Thalassovita sp.]
MNTINLQKKIIVSGEIHTLTGLMIGGSNTAMGIGGPDRMVIRNPITNQPYIPGSSLKGKMRSLMEISFGNIGEVNMGKVKYGVDSDINNSSTLLFGSTHKDISKQRPSRIIVRDGNLLNPEDFTNTELPFTEAKTEVVIDRITSAAMPRTFERVPAGAIFKLELVLNIFEEDKKEDELKNLTFKALQLVQDDYLGGSGSRGSGQVRFYITNIVERSSGYYHSKDDEVKLEIPDIFKK